MRPMSSRNVSTSATRSSFSDVLTRAFHGAAPSASRSADVPAAAAPERATTSRPSLSGDTPAKRVLGSRSSSFRSVLNVTLFCSPKPCAARAISSGVKPRSTRPADSRRFASRDRNRNSSNDGARLAVRFSPGSNGQGPTLSSLSCNGLWVEGGGRDFRFEFARGARVGETALGREDRTKLVLEVGALGRVRIILVPIALAVREFRVAFDHFAERAIFGQSLAGLLHRLFHFRRFVRGVGPSVAFGIRPKSPVSRDMAEDDGEFVVVQQAIVGEGAQSPRRKRVSIGLGLDTPHRLSQRVAGDVAEQSEAMEDRAHVVHALSAAPDNAPLTARATANRAFGFPCLVDERRVETTNPRGDDSRGLAFRLDDRPSAGRNAEINAKDAHDGNSTQHTAIADY